MNEETKKLIQDQVANLPEHIRESLKKINWGEEIVSIGKKNGLHVDQMGELHLETILVLVGLVHPDEYLANLKSALKLNDAQITPIITEVNEKIFKTIRQSLIDFMAAEDAKSQIIEKKEPVPIATKAPALTRPSIQLMPETLASAGVEVIPNTLSVKGKESQNTPINLTEKTILEKSGVHLEEAQQKIDALIPPDRNELLEKVEHPEIMKETRFSKLVTTSLSALTQQTPQKTSYKDASPSLTATTPPQKTNTDPYREPVN